MEYAERLKVISENLKKSSKVNSYDSLSEKESDTLAHALSDMDESFRTISRDLIPKLSSKEISQEEVNETLLDIGEELRHILYHIKDTKFYNYLSDSL